jgi:antitoxin YqcF
MSTVSKENKIIAQHAAKAFGGKPKVSRYWDDNHNSFVDLLVAEDRPQRGVDSYATIGLSDHPLMKGNEEYAARVELLGACGSQFAKFDNIIATAAFFIINSKRFCYPGAVFPDIVGMYKASKSLEHLFFAPPFLWEDRLKTLPLKGTKVAWLLIVPISENERLVAEKKGSEILESLFLEAQIDIFDLERASVV